MAEFKEISPNASAGAKLTNWFENRFPTAFDAYRVHMAEYYAPKTSTCGTSLARCPCWCW